MVLILTDHRCFHVIKHLIICLCCLLRYPNCGLMLLHKVLCLFKEFGKLGDLPLLRVPNDDSIDSELVMLSEFLLRHFEVVHSSIYHAL